MRKSKLVDDLGRVTGMAKSELMVAALIFFPLFFFGVLIFNMDNDEKKFNNFIRDSVEIDKKIKNTKSNFSYFFKSENNFMELFQAGIEMKDLKCNNESNECVFKKDEENGLISSVVNVKLENKDNTSVLTIVQNANSLKPKEEIDDSNIKASYLFYNRLHDNMIREFYDENMEVRHYFANKNNVNKPVKRERGYSNQDYVLVSRYTQKI